MSQSCLARKINFPHDDGHYGDDEGNVLTGQEIFRRCNFDSN